MQWQEWYVPVDNASVWTGREEKGILKADLPRRATMITSKLTSKAQTTIPQQVRAALNLRAGDEFQYRVDRQRVILTKVETAQAVDDPFRTFDEWYSDADERAHANL